MTFVSILTPPTTINTIANNYITRKNYYSKPAFLDV